VREREREREKVSDLPVCNIPEDTGYHNIANAGNPPGAANAILEG